MAKTNKVVRPTANRSERPARVSMAADDDILAVEGKDPNYHYHWINDEGTKMKRAVNAWYVNVKNSEVNLSLGGGDDTEGADGNCRKQVGHKADGSPLYSYLMKINLKYYEEDAAKKQEKVLNAETAITQINTQDGQYVPK